MSTAPRLRIRWHTIAIAAATAGLLWLFFRTIDLAETWRAITHAHPLYILGAIAATLTTYILRSVRWLALLRPIGRASFRTAIRTTVLGFSANFLLPGRPGEVLRAYLLARQEGFSAPATFATVIIERLLDIATVLLFLGVGLAAVGGGIRSEIKLGAALAFVIAIGGLVVLFLMAGHPERLGQWAGRVGRRLPRKMADALGHIVQTFAEGLVVMRRPADLAVAALWSGPVWLSIALGIWLTSHAFDLTVSFVGSFLVVAYLAVGVSVPTPGGAGGFHLTYQLAMTQFFGASPSVAAAAAIVLHAVSFVPVTIVGLWVMWQDGLSLGRLKSMRTEAQAAERPDAGAP